MEAEASALLEALNAEWGQRAAPQPTDEALLSACRAFRRQQLCVILQTLAAGADASDAELALWKHSVYKFIDAFRRMAKTGARADTALALRSFLDEATGMYLQLLADVQQTLPGGPVTPAGVRVAHLTPTLETCHRCLQYLGDLARYDISSTSTNSSTGCNARVFSLEGGGAKKK